MPKLVTVVDHLCLLQDPGLNLHPYYENSSIHTEAIKDSSIVSVVIVVIDRAVKGKWTMSSEW
jgi:hypothetical protein